MSYRIGSALLAVMSLCGVVFMILDIWNSTPKQGDDFVLGLLAVIGLIFLPGFALFIACFRQTFAEYEMDENGVTKRLFAVRKKILWQEVSHIGLNGSPNYEGRVLRIVDTRRNTLVFHPGLIENGSELSEKIEAFSEPHIEGRYESSVMNASFFKMNSAVAYAMFYFGLIFFVIVAMFIDLVNQQTPVPTALQPIPNLQLIIFILCTFGMMGFGCLMYGLKLLTNRITLTPASIIETHLFKTVEIPFSELQTFYRIKMIHKGGSYLQYSLKACHNRSILITPAFTDHNVLVAILKERTKDLTLISGEAFAEQDKRVRANRIIGFISLLSAISMLSCGGTGIWKIGASQKRLHQYDILEQEGRKEQGIVRSKIVEEGRYRQYFVEYSYKAEGNQYESSNPVGQEIYDELKIGEPVSLKYLSKNPKFSMLRNSIGRQRTQVEVFGGWAMLVASLILFPLMFWLFYKMFQKMIRVETEITLVR